MDVHERSSTAPIFKDSYSSLVFIKSDCVTSLSRKHVNRIHRADTGCIVKVNVMKLLCQVAKNRATM